MRDWVATYLEEVVGLYPGFATHERYTSAARLHIVPTVGDVPLQELSPRHIRSMDRTLADGATSKDGLSPRSIQIVHTVLSGTYEYAIEMDMVDYNPIRSGPWPKAARKKIVSPEMLPIERLRALAGVDQHWLHPFIHVLNCTGMRRGEAMALDWACVDWGSRVINVRLAAGKSHKHGMLVKAPKSLSGIRAIALDVGTIEVLRRQRESQIAAGISHGRVGWVFPAPDGGLMKPTTMLRQLKELGARVGLPTITFHSLRHFHILERHNSQGIPLNRPGPSARAYLFLLKRWEGRNPIARSTERLRRFWHALSCSAWVRAFRCGSATSHRMPQFVARFRPSVGLVRARVSRSG